MRSSHPIDVLQAVSREFGVAAAARKLALLRALSGLGKVAPGRLRQLHDTLCFLRAYPDNRQVLGEVLKQIQRLPVLVQGCSGGDPLLFGLVNTGLPGSANSYAYSYAVLQRMVELQSDVEIDWEEVVDESLLNYAMDTLVAPAEARGLEDEDLSARDWLQVCKQDKGASDVATLLGIFEDSTLDPHQQMHMFESCDLPMVYGLSQPGTATAEVAIKEIRPHYQRRAIVRDRFPLAPWIRKPLGGSRKLSPAAGQRILDLSLRALCARNLEIYPLIYANPADVIEVDCARGLKVILGGVLPAFRTVPETLSFFLTLKNGVPVAYGPASVVLGRCEMGINLFPEFRGGEIHLIYAEFMRAMHHLAGVRYFYITPYGMGVDNEAALESGAFWFYRKLGFLPTNPEVETLAREEEAVMSRSPGYRSSRATLKRLSNTHVYMDLDGNTMRLDYGELSRQVTRRMALDFGSARRRGVRARVRTLLRNLEIDDHGSWNPEEKAAMERLAPLFGLIPDLETWPKPDRRRLGRAIKSQGKSSELAYLHALAKIPRLNKAFETLAGVP